MAAGSGVASLDPVPGEDSSGGTMAVGTAVGTGVGTGVAVDTTLGVAVTAEVGVALASLSGEVPAGGGWRWGVGTGV